MITPIPEPPLHYRNTLPRRQCGGHSFEHDHHDSKQCVVCKPRTASSSVPRIIKEDSSDEFGTLTSVIIRWKTGKRSGIWYLTAMREEGARTSGLPEVQRSVHEGHEAVNWLCQPGSRGEEKRTLKLTIPSIDVHNPRDPTIAKTILFPL